MRYTIKESQYRRLIKIISEQTQDPLSGQTISKFASYGDISRVDGSETDAVASATAGQIGQTIELFTDKELRKKWANYSLKSMTNNNGQIVVALKASPDFNLTASCSTLPTDGAFLKGSEKYYSKILLDMALEKCKS